MSNDDLHISPKQGWLRVKLHSHSKWHRRYCSIDWDKAILFIASKADRRHREWLKLLPHIVLNDCESSSDNTIEIKSDNESHSLQAESRAEYEQWFLALKRTAYSRIGGGIFGQSLESTYKYSREKSSPVPLIVRQCCEFLLEHGSTFVGLFRVPGKQSSIKELRDMYDRGLVIELSECYSPATISSLLKIYLHSLPEPIIPEKHFDEFFEFGSRLKYNQTQDIDRLKRLIDRTLSGINHALLAYLCLFLKKLTHYAHETKMDTDNLAVTFGNNLIRPAEELDLNMIKGHNYNLFPLIKVFIDHSEYLFLINSSSTSETNNESIAKSSGFSSFSSLLSTNEQPPKLNSRSSSMPSIRFTTFSSVDSSHLSSDDQLDAEPRSQPVMASDAGNEQSFLTCCEEGEEDNGNDKPINLRLKRFSCVDGVNDDARTKKHSVVFEQRHRSDISPPIICSSSTVSSPARKSSKKTFANKVGKSLSSFKTSMTRAFHPQLASTENLQYSSTINISAQLSAPLHEGLRGLQDEIRTLKQLITRKEVLLHHVTKNSQDDRLKYERENLELRQRIEQLQAENTKLKACHESDI